jgi:ornithine cyclodeaminase
LGSNIQHVTKIGIVGGGVQAVWQLRLLQVGVLPKECRTVVVKTRSKESAEAFIQRMKESTYPPDREWMFEHYISTTEGGRGFKECKLIHTMTPAREPVVSLEDVNIRNDDFLHITCVGADSPGKTELTKDLIHAANYLVCDSIDQTKERGEFQLVESRNDIVELGSLLEEQKSRHIQGVSIFDSSGLPLQDVEMAQLISCYI